MVITNAACTKVGVIVERVTGTAVNRAEWQHVAIFDSHYANVINPDAVEELSERRVTQDSINEKQDKTTMNNQKTTIHRKGTALDNWGIFHTSQGVVLWRVCDVKKL